MKTLTTSMILSVMFLSAGAFAGSSHKLPELTVASPQIENVTVVLKNQAWPPAGFTTVEPCSIRRCIDI